MGTGLTKEMQNKIKQMFENKKFQRLWKRKLYEMEDQNKSKSSIILNNRWNTFYLGSKHLSIHCDFCSNVMKDQRLCYFKSCGHCFCAKCRRKVRRDRQCSVCIQDICARNFYYLIPQKSICN